MALATATSDGKTVQLSATEWEAINRRLTELEQRLALATGWMQAKGATRDELKRMGLTAFVPAVKR